MKDKLLIVIISVILLLSYSCKDDDNNTKLDKYETDRGIVSSNVETLSKRLVQVNEPADFVAFQPFQSVSSRAKEVDTKDKYYWDYIASVEGLVYNNFRLSATYIEIVGDIAYVSYNLQGDIHKGAVEAIDLSSKAEPKIISRVIFEDTDINSLLVDRSTTAENQRIWLAGSDKAKGGVVIELMLVANKFQEAVKVLNLSKHLDGVISASCNSIAHIGDHIYATSGKTNGGLFKIHVSDFLYVSHEVFSNAKSVISNGDYLSAKNLIVLSSGDNAELRIFDIGNNSPVKTFDIGTIVHSDVENPYSGKSTLFVAKDNSKEVYVSMASGGLKVFNINTGKVEESSIDGMLSIGNTNSIVVDDEFIYLANGSDGLAIALLPEKKDKQITPIFTWDMASVPASANFVASDGEFLFVAKGLGGFKVLRKTPYGEHPAISAFDDDGVPTELHDDRDVCSTLLPAIYEKILPNGANTLVTHPEYFLETVKNIYLKEEADVLVTFLDEGAGYTNVLGYYFYDKNTPPKNVNDLEKRIIFPNTSKQGSGGGLVKGNTMKLLGHFDANTVIGFYLISNGWNSKDKVVTDGYYTHYTNPEFNKNNEIQTVTFYDVTCGSTVIGFEDVRILKGDNDFNDAIFEITTNPATAIEVSKYIQITE